MTQAPPAHTLQLTDEQHAVIRATPDAHLTVLAVAGSGKTTTMAHRIAHLVKHHGVRPAQVRAVMFNKAAQLHFERKLDALGVDTYAAKVQTWHALSYALIRAAEADGMLEQAPLLTDQSAILRAVGECAREALADRGEKSEEDDGRDAETCLEAIREWKSMLVLPGHAGHADDDFLVEVYARFEKRRAREHFRTFDDLTGDAVTLLATDRGRAAFAARFEHLVIDEFQDADLAQFRLLELLAGSRARVTVVGDDDQTIHEWRGARSGFIRGGFAQQFKTHQHVTLPLTRSFRFGAAIAQCAWNAIAVSQERIPKDLVAHTPRKPSRVILRATATESDDAIGLDVAEADALIEDIRTLRETGVSLRDMVVLGRSWTQLLGMQWRLLAAEIPFTVDQHNAFVHDPSLALMRQYLMLVERFRSPLDDESARVLGTVVNRPFRKVSKQGIVKVIADVRRAGGSIADVLFDESAHKLAGIFPGASGALRHMGSVLMKASRIANEPCGAAMVIRLLRREVEFKEALAAFRSEESVAACLRAYEVFEGFARSSACTLSDLERIVHEVDTTQSAPLEQCLRVTTVHRVKGLEWKHVFIPECDEGRMPILGEAESACFDTKDASKTDGRSKALESERRLFYVALTRASECCWISCGDVQARSRFIDDALIEETQAALHAFAQAADEKPMDPRAKRALLATLGESSVARRGCEQAFASV
ncbi:MAG: ATP-dependent helicase [Phycisphaerales bacterium]|nr:ATP-dependent helicase [Phycisphaerales bacterium]